MSFRKRNLAISQKGDLDPASRKQSLPGVRTSPVTGHQTTSTGTESLDKLLGLGAGLALRSSLLIEEEGSTDFASSLSRCFAAEGVLQGHAVFVVAPEGSITLPGIAEESTSKSLGSGSRDTEKMKIAWRYERLGGFDKRERGTPQQQPSLSQVAEMSPSNAVQAAQEPFCHTFDLTKRLKPPPSSLPITYLTPSPLPTSSPFSSILSKLSSHLSANPALPKRLILPTLLSPIIYPASASQPDHLLGFLHQLRGLLRTFTNLTIFVTWPAALYPSYHPQTRWTRHIMDGVITLHPFPHSYSVDAEVGSNAKGNSEEMMQGLLKVIKLPVLSEKGVGIGVGEDMAFAVGRKRFLIRPFHLPPLEAGDETGPEQSGDKSGADLEF